MILMSVMTRNSESPIEASGRHKRAAVLSVARCTSLIQPVFYYSQRIAGSQPFHSR